uniref:Uncharacterized protein n=1 Tax=Arundo donax TaxID=35708 RepID=A0A0A9A815_ARUDO
MLCSLTGYFSKLTSMLFFFHNVFPPSQNVRRNKI